MIDTEYAVLHSLQETLNTLCGENEFVQFDIHKYFRTIVCADDTVEHKPMPAPLFKYMKLAVWGSHTQSISADYYLKKPIDMVTAISEIDQRKSSSASIAVRG